MSALTDVTTKEHIHALAALTRGISLLLYDNKQKRKFVKNPSAVNIGGISDEKYSEAFGNDLQNDSVLAKVFLDWTKLDISEFGNNKYFWAFVTEIYGHYKDTVLTEEMSN